jgi:hypothetical protein
MIHDVIIQDVSLPKEISGAPQHISNIHYCRRVFSSVVLSVVFVDHWFCVLVRIYRSNGEQDDGEIETRVRSYGANVPNAGRMLLVSLSSHWLVTLRSCYLFLFDDAR